MRREGIHNEQKNCGWASWRHVQRRYASRACRILIRALEVLDCPLWMCNVWKKKTERDRKLHNLKVKCASNAASEVRVHFPNSQIKLMILFRSCDSSLTALCSSLYKECEQRGIKQVLGWCNCGCIALHKLFIKISEAEGRKTERNCKNEAVLHFCRCICVVKKAAIWHRFRKRKGFF